MELDDGMDRASFVKAINHVVTERIEWPEYIVDMVVQLYSNQTQSQDDPIVNRDKYVEVNKCSQLFFHGDVLKLLMM